jgi:Asp-tRNA(Asn)/Glu-tRNA(Gln) amidotransferase A subunit family amidase
MTVPCELTEKHLPVGLQFLAKAGDEFGAILAARTWQETRTGVGNTHAPHKSKPIADTRVAASFASPLH